MKTGRQEGAAKAGQSAGQGAQAPRRRSRSTSSSRTSSRARERAGQLPPPGRVAAGRGRLARRGPRAGRRAVRRGVGRGRHAGRRARARPRPVGPGPRRRRGDRPGAREDRRRHLRRSARSAARPSRRSGSGRCRTRPVRAAARAGASAAADPTVGGLPAEPTGHDEGMTGPTATSRAGGVRRAALAARRRSRPSRWRSTSSPSGGPSTRLDDGDTIDLVGSLRLASPSTRRRRSASADGRGPLIVAARPRRRGRRPAVAPGATPPAGAGRSRSAWSLGGALGNLIDRAFREGDGFLGGAVVDFIDLQWWPVFNVADVGDRGRVRSCCSSSSGASPSPTSRSAEPVDEPERRDRPRRRSSAGPRRASGSTGWWPCSPACSRAEAAGLVDDGAVARRRRAPVTTRSHRVVEGDELEVDVPGPAAAADARRRRRRSPCRWCTTTTT